MYSPRTGPNLNASAEPPPSSQTLSKSGVAVDDEVLVDAHLVVAGAGLVERGAGQIREVPVEDLARARVRRGGDPAVARVGIRRRTAADADAEAAVVGRERRPAGAARHAVARHVRVGEARVAGRHGEVEHVAHRVPQAAPHQRREELGEPGAAGEDGDARGEGVAVFERHRFERGAGPAAGRGAADADGSALLLENPRHGFHRPPRADDAGRRLVQGEAEVVEADPRPAVRRLVRRQHLVGHGQRIPVAARGLDVGSRLLAEDEVARLEEQPREEPVAAALVPLDPLADGVVGPARPQSAVGPVAVRRAHAARLAAGGLPRVARAVGVQHGDPGAEPPQVERGPQAEGAGPDHDDVGVAAALACGRAGARRGTGWPDRARSGADTGANGRGGGGGNEPASVDCHGATGTHHAI